MTDFLTEIDELVRDAIPEILEEFGGLVDIEIKQEGTGTPTFNSDSNEGTPIVYSNLRVTPVTGYEKVLYAQGFTIVTEFECYVMAGDVPVVPIPEKSFLTVKQHSLTGLVVTTNKLTIRKVFPVMTGRAVGMYQLICKG